MATLNLKGDYGVEILSYYLWGAEKEGKAPTRSEIADEKWIDKKAVTVSIKASEYMQYVDRYTNAKSFGIFNKFFNKIFTQSELQSVNATLNSDGNYELNLKQISKIIYGEEDYLTKEKGINRVLGVSHYKLDTNSSDYAKRAFTFGSTKMTYDINVKFIIDGKTLQAKALNDLAIYPKDDDFDFVGGAGSFLANHYLEKLTDPSGIGRKVMIKFDNDIKAISLRKDEFLNLENKTNSQSSMDIDAFAYYFNNNILSSRVIDYLDKDGKLVMFGSSGNDTLSGTKAKNLDFDELLFSELGGITNHYKKYVDNGIHYIGGDGADSITGTDKDDILKGGSGADTLNGKEGYDIYYADNGDTIYDSDGKGRVYLNNTQLRGGKFNENLSSGNIEIYESNDGNITYEYDTNSKTLKANGLTINDFDNEELEINLTKELVNEFAILSDTTGSMGGAINSVKAQAIDIVNSAFERDPNARIGVFGYNDPSVQTFTNLTNDQGAVISAINSLYADDGGDTPEMTYRGIYNAANSNWSEYSVKRIFIFGDAPAKDTDFKETALTALKPNSTKTRDAFKSNDSDLNNIQVFAIQTGGGAEVAKEFREIAEFSGGAYINLATSDYESVADILFDMMNLGTNKSETIIGNDKNNTLNGKGGDDILQGGLGSDTYEFDDNFGKDTIIETNPNNNDKNIIKFNNLTTIKDLTFTQNANDLIINHKNKQNSITIKGFYTNETKISFLEFADGSKLSNTDLKDFALMQNNKSMLHYAQANEPNLNENLKSTFFMADKNTPSNISGAMLNDSLIGSDKNDSIWGGYGNDILIGKKGNDTLNGGKGDDKYIYTKFDGSDIIQDNGGSDTLVLKGISKDEANFTQSGKDLIISFNFNNDKITIKDHFKGLLRSNKIENIIFDKDENLTISQIDEFITNKWNKITYNDISNKFNSNISESVGEFISQEKIDKIIEQINTYSDDKGLGNFAFNDIQNSQNLQLYGV